MATEETREAGESIPSPDTGRWALAEASDDLVFLLEVRPGGSTPRYRCVAASQGWCRVVGATDATVVGRSPEEFLPPRVAAELLERSDDALQTERRVRCVVETECADRRLRLDTVLEPIIDASGVCTHLLGVAHDLDAVRLSTRAEGPDARFRALAASAPIGIFVRDLQTDEVLANQRLLDIVGVSHGVGRADSWLSAVHPDDAARVRGIRDELVSSGGERELRFRIHRRDGQERELRARVSVLSDTDGGSGSIVGSVEDVTDSVDAARASSRLAAVCDATSDFVGVADADGRLVYLNPAARALLDVGPTASLDELEWHSLFPDWAARELMHEVALCLDRDRRWSGELALLARDGREVPVSLVITMHPDTDGTFTFTSTIARDISHEKAVRAEVALSSGRLASIAMSVSDAVTVADTRGRVRYASESCQGLLGYSAEEVVGRSLTEFLDADSLRRAFLAFRDVVEHRVPSTTIEVAARHRDGSLVWLEMTLIDELDTPDVAGIVLVSRDVTHRREVEDALRENEDRFRRLADHAPLGILQTDRRGRVVFVNQRWLDIVGCTLEQITGPGASNMIHPDDRARTTRAGHEAFLARQELALRYRIVRRDGEIRWMRTHATPIFDERDELVGYVGSMEDVTDEATARRTHDRLVAVLEATPDYTSIVDSDGRTVFMNAALRHLIGVEDALDLSAIDLWSRYPPWACQVIEADVRPTLARRGMWSGELALRAADGREVPVSQVTIRHAGDDGRPYYSTIARDITSLKEIEARLATSEAWYRSLVLHAMDLVTVRGRDGLRYVSLSVERLLGYEPERLRNGDVSEIVHPDDVDLFRSVLSDVESRPGATAQVEYRIQHSDGTWRWLNSKITNLLDDPVVAGIVTNSHDVTERRMAEDARTRSETALRAIVQGSPLAIYAVDREGAVQLWSHACERLFGWSEDEVVGRPVPFVSETHTSEFDDLRERTFAGETLRDFEVRGRRKDESPVDVSLSAAPIRDATGRVVTVMGVISDVTDRKRAEAALRASEERFRSLTERSSDLVTVVDAAGRLTYLSPSAARLVGIDPLDAIGRLLPNLLHPDDAEPIAAVIESLRQHGGASPPFHMRMRAKGSEWRWVEAIATGLLDDPTVAGIVINARDVTERYRAEETLREINEALRQSNETLAAIVENSPLAIAAIGPDGRVQLWNPACERLFGWSAPDVLGRIAPFLPAESLDAFRAIAVRVFDGEIVTGAESHQLRRDGAPVELSVSAAPMRDEDGTVVSVLAVIVDVTAERAAQTAVEESEARFRALVQSSSDIVAILEADATMRYVSPSCHRILGYDPADLLGTSPLELLHPDDLAGTGAVLAGSAGRQGVGPPVQVRFRHADGSWRHVEAQAADLRDDPAIGGFVVTARDVTERYQAEEAVRQSEERFRALVQNLSDMITIVDRDGTIRWSSPATQRVLGYEPDGVASNHPLNHIHPDDAERVRTRLREQLPRSGSGEPIEFRVQHADGSWRDVEAIAGNLLEDPAVEGIVFTTRDITERKQAERRIEASEARYRAVVEDQTELVGRYNLDGVLTFANEAFARFFDRDVGSIVGTEFRPPAPGDDAAFVDRALAMLDATHAVETFEGRVTRADGVHRWHQWMVRAVLDEHDGVVEYQVVGRDVTEQHDAESVLAAQARILELIAKGTPLTEVLAEMCRVVEERLPQVLCSVMLVTDDAVNLRFGAAPSLPSDYVRDVAMMAIGPAAGSAGTAAYRDERIVVADVRSDPRWVEHLEVADRNGLRACWSTPIHGSDRGPVLGTFDVYGREPGEPTGEHIRVVDLVVRLAAIAIERTTFEARLAHQAHHDPLTGLPNRLLFFEFLTLALARSQRYRSTVAVLFLDLDRFKVVNDSMGHDSGDELLREVSDRLQSVVRPGDTVSRFGGDEFTILCEDLSGPEARQQAVDVAERLLDVLRRPFALGGEEVFLSSSIGIALAGGADDRPEALLRDADAAMYRAKERGKGRWELFDEAMRATVMQRLETENALHRALERREFQVFYQPVVSLREGRCVGAEALVRWQHSERGLVTPHDFIDLAEETGLIVPLGMWVLEQACDQAARWQVQSRARDRFVVAVNLSGRQLSQPDLIDRVADALERSGADPACLCLEITESVLMDDADATIDSLRALKRLGVKLSVDDFGTGYSSLGYLKRFPVDSVKVDRSFVDGLGTDPEDSAIVAAVVSLGHALGLAVVAEGVETEEQIRELVALGCDDAQGFFFAPPQSASDLQDLLARDLPWRPPGAAATSDESRP